MYHDGRQKLAPLFMLAGRNLAQDSSNLCAIPFPGHVHIGQRGDNTVVGQPSLACRLSNRVIDAFVNFMIHRNSFFS